MLVAGAGCWCLLLLVDPSIAAFCTAVWSRSDLPLVDLAIVVRLCLPPLPGKGELFQHAGAANQQTLAQTITEIDLWWLPSASGLLCL